MHIYNSYGFYLRFIISIESFIFQDRAYIIIVNVIIIIIIINLLYTHMLMWVSLRVGSHLQYTLNPSVLSIAYLSK